MLILNFNTHNYSWTADHGEAHVSLQKISLAEHKTVLAKHAVL